MFLFEDLLELEGNHALEGQHFHLGKDALPGEEIAEIAATVGVLRCFCFHRFMESAWPISRRVWCDLAADLRSTLLLGTHQFVI